MMSSFHFIRPWWLLAFIPLAGLIWMIRHRQNANATLSWRGIIAPPLLPFLLSHPQTNRKRRFSPLILLGFAWGITVFAIAGPTSRREPSPFVDDIAPLAIIVKVTPSMTTEDIQPSRLARSVQKTSNLLALRRGAHAALVAYAGTAHLVVPLTTDGSIIDSFAQALNPEIMPGSGDAAVEALRLAGRTLGESGSILWMTDELNEEQIPLLAQWKRETALPVQLLPPLPEGSELDQLLHNVHAIGWRVVKITADDSDVEQLARTARFSTASANEPGDRWQESGYWLTPFLAVALLPFFRKGWMAASATS